MPALGEIKRAKETGYASHKLIWAACEDCGKQRWVKLFCGEPISKRCKGCAKRGIQSPHWKGGIIRVNGYVFLLKPEHPRARKNGYVGRARLVLEERLGRYLLDGYIPHHINGITDDDRPENLEEMLVGKHHGLHNSLRRLINRDKANPAVLTLS